MADLGTPVNKHASSPGPRFHARALLSGTLAVVIEGGVREDDRVRFVDTDGFVADAAWGVLELGEIDGVTVRVHWTDQPYRWHVNDGSEVFVVLDGAVDMHYRDHGHERVERLTPGRVCIAEEGDEHVARPVATARILVVERKGSV